MSSFHSNASKPNDAKSNLDVRAAAVYLGLSEGFLNRLRSKGGGPAFCKLGSRIVYRLADLNDWLETRRRTSTSDIGAT